MNLLNALVSVLPESNFSQHHFRHSYKFPLCALFLMLALLASRAAYATTYTVTDLTDSATDTGSLRYAVNTAVDGDVINFAPNVIGTITLTNGTLTISNSVTITGPGPSLLTISGSTNGANIAFKINSGTVNISGLAIANSNTISPGGGGLVGGGIYNSGTLTLSYSTVSNNTGGDGAGGIYNQGTLTVENSTISNNTGSGNVGGGIVNGGTLTVENSTISGNATTSGSPGGGIYNMGTLTVQNSTISGNTAGDGIYNQSEMGGTVTITDSIVAGNTGSDCDNCGTQSANNLIGVTPDLGPLQYNGGDTETMIPLPGSPVIGAGSGSSLATDQRGFARSTSGTSDLGAVQTNYLTVTTLADSTDVGTCTGGATCSLRDAITLANSDNSGDIVFHSGLTGTITLASILPFVTADTSVTGPGANLLTISGGENSSVLDIPNGGTAFNLNGVTIANGSDLINFTASVSNSGRLSIENSAFSGNGNGSGNGGAIFNDGILGVEDCTFYNDNSANYGGGIYNSGTLIVANSTFTDNRDYNGNGGAIENSGAAIVYDSTITGNNSLNGGVGAGMDSSGGSLTVTNSIVAANINLNGNTEDDCNNCTQNGPMLTGPNPGLGQLVYNGLNATVQTMLPLPGSPAIQAGNPTLLPVGLTTDERGFPRLTGGKLDLGAAQTNYTSVQFVQQPSNAVFNVDISPAVTVEVLETNTNLPGPNNTDAVDGIPITLTLNGSGTFGGTLTQTTSGGVASFGDLTVSAAGTGNTLATTLTVTPAQTLTATSNTFDITLQTQTITFTPPPANVTYGVAPIVLAATSSASLPVTFQVDMGPATIQGNTLTITGAGTVEVEADAAAAGNYAAATPVTETILVAQAASSLSLTASATSAPTGGSVTLTATASSTTTGTPTGTVTFLSDGSSIGTAQLSGGVAQLKLSTLPAGSNTITATYPGDTNFLGSSAQLAGTILVGTPGFTMTSNLSSFSILPGGEMTLALTLTPTFGYTGTATLACSNLPKQSTCLFYPTSVTFNGSGNPMQVTLTMEIGSLGITADTSVAELRPWKPLGGMPMLPAMILWAPGTEKMIEERYGRKQAQRKSKSKSARMLLMVALLALSAGFLGLVGCAGQTIPYTGPAAGQQTVTITATGTGNITQSVAVQVTIQ